MNRTLVRLGLTVLALAMLLGTAAWPSATATGNARETPAIYARSAHLHHGAMAQQAQPAREGDITPLLGNLGNHQHPITTGSALAQRYFDEGLILTFGFNHAEAIRSFKDAATLDPNCAMCHWGIALALGPNINAPMEATAVAPAYEALQKALELAPNASPAEQAYIRALAARYGPEPVADRAPLDLAYADAMRALSRQYPDDLDAATLFAEALMDLMPWNFWTKDGQATTYTDEIVMTLESVLARNPDHPGANHFYIHAVEASDTPERTIPSARRLETLVPGASHLVHMPSHTYWRVGRYHDAARVNEWAIRADQAYLVGGTPDRSVHSFYSLAYASHNVHFLFAAAHMEGRSGLALDAARRLVARIPDEAYRQVPPLEDFRPMPLFAQVRFGKWAEILEEPQPAADLQYTTGVWHWARGLAYLRQGRLDAAEREYARLAEIAESDAMKELTLASFPKAATLLDIAVRVLAGELAGARGQTDEMVGRFAEAAAIQDGLPYIEPPSWFYPVRHNLGAALLEVGRPAEAEAVYREDLRQYPENGRSLFGLAASLRAQGKAAEAAEAQQRFEAAWQHADVTLTSSRF